MDNLNGSLVIPSGKGAICYGKSRTKWQFSIAMLVYQRVFPPYTGFEIFKRY